MTRSRGGGRVAIALPLALLLMLAPGRAAAEPSDRTLLFTGMALAPADYLLGVAIHEGSHAIAAKAAGATVTEIHLFPPGVDPKVHKFRFGWTYVQGLTGRTAHVVFYLAPKLTDLALFGGFAALVYTDGWPSNRYGQLALTVFATGLWVDFAKDVLLFAPQNDVSRALHTWCMTGWRQLPARLVYGSVAAGLAVVVWHGYERTFDRTLGEPAAGAPATALIVPVITGAF